MTKYPDGTVADTPSLLNEVYLPVVDPDTCFSQILQMGRANGFEYRIDSKKQICMGVPEGGKDACQVASLYFRLDHKTFRVTQVVRLFVIKATQLFYMELYQME